MVLLLLEPVRQAWLQHISYRPDFSWINFNATDHSGWPQTNRGISENYQGLYFAGMIFQFSLKSGLVGGVSRDAAFIENHIKTRKVQ